MKRSSLAAVFSGLLLASCEAYYQPPVLCPEIPEGGCPKGRGGTCDDHSCQALYACFDGKWERVETCDASASGGGSTTGGAGGASTTGTGASSSGGAAGSTTSSGGTGGCTPIMLDHTGETTGCEPDLQEPDCPAAAAEQCPESACLTGCTDFYICKTDPATMTKGWSAVAYCDERGAFFVAPR